MTLIHSIYAYSADDELTHTDGVMLLYCHAQHFFTQVFISRATCRLGGGLCRPGRYIQAVKMRLLRLIISLRFPAPQLRLPLPRPLPLPERPAICRLLKSQLVGLLRGWLA